MNGFGTIDKKDINELISSIENKINFIRNDISQNVTSLKNQLNACTEELNRLKKLVIQVTDYNDTEYKKIENRINEFAKDIEDIKSKLNTIQYNEIAAGKCASGINEYPIYAKYAENDTNGHKLPEYYASKSDLSNVSSTLSADYTEKIAESSSGGMSALSSVSGILTTNLERETQERSEADIIIKNSIVSETTRALQSESNLNTKIDEEISRSTNKDTILEQKITFEQNRAETAESNLQESLSNETSRATEEENELLTNLNGEIKRATGIETGLRTDLDYEITRAKGVENELQNKIDSEAKLRETTDNKIQTNLNNEITRATGVETSLDIKIDTNKNEIYDTISAISGHLSSSIISEYNDRVSVDISLQNQIDTIEATQNVIDLVADYAALTEYDTTNVKVNDKIQVICDETSANQTTIYSWNNNTWNGIGMFGPYYTKSQVDTKIDDEITRATNKESELELAINAEKTNRETNIDELKSDIEELNTNKQNNLTAGAGIDLTNDTISVNTDIIATKESVADKKDRQNELTFDGSATKTVKKITQNANGELTVEFEDIDLPQEVPNVDITSVDNSVKVTETTDVQTNTKKFDLSVNVEDPLEYGQFRATNVTSQAFLNKVNGNLELNNYAIKLKKGNSYHFTVRGSYVANNPVNTNSTIVYIEPISFNNINVNVDNTITEPQYFEISYDVYNYSQNGNYNVSFSSMSDGKVSELWVEVHNLNGVSVNGQGGGSGTTYSAGDAIDLTNDTISVKYGKGLEVNDSNQLEVKVGEGLSYNSENNSIEVNKDEINNYIDKSSFYINPNAITDWIDITDEFTFLNGFRAYYNNQSIPQFKPMYSPSTNILKFNGEMRINRTSVVPTGPIWTVMFKYVGNRFYNNKNAPTSEDRPILYPFAPVGNACLTPTSDSGGVSQIGLAKSAWVGDNRADDNMEGIGMQILFANNDVYGTILTNLMYKVTPITV